MVEFSLGVFKTTFLQGIGDKVSIGSTKNESGNGADCISCATSSCRNNRFWTIIHWLTASHWSSFSTCICEARILSCCTCILAKTYFLPAKTIFCQSGFYHGKNVFFPLTGKKLPTLVKLTVFKLLWWLVLPCCSLWRWSIWCWKLSSMMLPYQRRMLSVFVSSMTPKPIRRPSHLLWFVFYLLAYCVQNIKHCLCLKVLLSVVFVG